MRQPNRLSVQDFERASGLCDPLELFLVVKSQDPLQRRARSFRPDTAWAENRSAAAASYCRRAVSQVSTASQVRPAGGS
jgi:hypothetical protein